MKVYLNCKECVDLLLDYLEDTLAPATKQKLDEHISACPPCLNFLKTYKSCAGISGRLRDQEVRIPPEMESRLKSFLREQVKKT